VRLRRWSFHALAEALGEDDRECLGVIHIRDAGSELDGSKYREVAEAKRQTLWVLVYSSVPVFGTDEERLFRERVGADSDRIHFLRYGLPYGKTPRFVIDRVRRFATSTEPCPLERWKIIDPDRPDHLLALYLILTALRGLNLTQKEAVGDAWNRAGGKWTPVFWSTVRREFDERRREFEVSGFAGNDIARRLGHPSPLERQVPLSVYCCDDSLELTLMEDALRFQWDYFSNPAYETFRNVSHGWLQEIALDMNLCDNPHSIPSLKQEPREKALTSLYSAQNTMVRDFNPARLIDSSPIALPRKTRALLAGALDSMYHKQGYIQKCSEVLVENITAFESSLNELLRSWSEDSIVPPAQLQKFKSAMKAVDDTLKAITKRRLFT
jgi:hypothetical protein